MSRADDGVDISQRRRVRRDHVDIDAQPVGVKTDRLLHALRAIDRVKRRMRVKSDLAVAVDGAFAGIQKLVDVSLLDRVAAKLHLDIGDVADQLTRAVTGPDILDGEAGHALGKLDRFSNSKLTRRHVGNVATLDAPALALAGA